MIQTDGGKGTFDKVTVGTSTFQTLSSGKADFGGFYATWEGVQADMYGPKLNCFTEPDYGVPGNADTIGIITNDQDHLLQSGSGEEVRAGHQERVRIRLLASRTMPPRSSSRKLPTRISSSAFVKKSMKTIVDGQYWGDPAKIKDGSFVFGTNDTKGAQQYFDFLAEENAYTDAHGKTVHTAPAAKDIATDEFLK